MDSIIQWIATAMSMNMPIDKIHDTLASRNIEEHNIYLLMKAGEILYQARLDLYGEVL